MNEKPSYFSILTADVRYDERLRANEKIMYAEITSLSNAYGYCTASNNYFANLYKVNKNTVSTWINNLKKYGYILVEMEYLPDTRQVIKRKIFPNNTYQLKDGYPINKKMDTPSIKRETPPPQKDGYPINKKAEDNNTRMNNTRMNNTSNNNDHEVDFKQKIIKEWNSLDDNIPKLTTLNAGTKRYTMLTSRINEHGGKEVLKAIKNIDKSRFLKGYVTDFRITFDWFVRPNNFIKVLEGNYTDKVPASKPSSYENMSDAGGGISESTRKQFEEIKREMGM